MGNCNHSKERGEYGEKNKTFLFHNAIYFSEIKRDIL